MGRRPAGSTARAGATTAPARRLCHSQLTLCYATFGLYRVVPAHVPTHVPVSAAHTTGLLKRGYAKISSASSSGGETARPAGGGGAAGEALGRSRGGLTTKTRIAAEGRCRPLFLLITPGQRADRTQFEPVMDKVRVPRTGPGRPRRTPDSVGAERAYRNRLIHAYLRKRGIRHVIPEKKDHKAARLRRGSRGGRPRISTWSGTKIATPWSGPSGN
ncbi:hypothetical protein E0L36_19400 [Streptomyces sp. AJS327]|nr:hypothetical protein [Streptomyces sp. AJS327]